MYHPSRGGVRGGRDQFNWDDVKGDKHRENYLGHSIKAPVGRWQKGKDIHWYTRDRNADETAAREEIKRIQEEEDEAMQEMLGLAPRKAKVRQGNQLDEREVSELLKKDSEESTPYAAGERVQGLGFAPAPGQTLPGQTAHAKAGASQTVVVYEKDSSVLTTGQENKELSGNMDEIDGTLDGLVNVEVQATKDESEKDRISTSSDEEGYSRKKRKAERQRAKEQRREEKRSRKQARKELKEEKTKQEERPESYHEERREGKSTMRQESADWDHSRGDAGRISHIHWNEQSWKGSLVKGKNYETGNARHDSQDSEGSWQETVDKSQTHAKMQLSRDYRSYHSSKGRGKMRQDSSEERDGKRGDARHSPTRFKSPFRRKSPYKDRSEGRGNVGWDTVGGESDRQEVERGRSSHRDVQLERPSYKRRTEDRFQGRTYNYERDDRKGETSQRSSNGVNMHPERNSLSKKRLEVRGKVSYDSGDGEGWGKDGRKNPSFQSRRDLSHTAKDWHDIEERDDRNGDSSPSNSLLPRRSSIYQERNEGRGKSRYDGELKKGSRKDAGTQGSGEVEVRMEREFSYKELGEEDEPLRHKSRDRAEARKFSGSPNNVGRQSSYLAAQNGHGRYDRGEASENSSDDENKMKRRKVDTTVRSKRLNKRLRHDTDDEGNTRPTERRR